MLAARPDGGNLAGEPAPPRLGARRADAGRARPSGRSAVAAAGAWRCSIALPQLDGGAPTTGKRATGRSTTTPTRSAPSARRSSGACTCTSSAAAAARRVHRGDGASRRASLRSPSAEPGRRAWSGCRRRSAAPSSSRIEERLVSHYRVRPREASRARAACPGAAIPPRSCPAQRRADLPRVPVRRGAPSGTALPNAIAVTASRQHSRDDAPRRGARPYRATEGPGPLRREVKDRQSRCLPGSGRRFASCEAILRAMPTNRSRSPGGSPPGPALFM